MANDNAVDYLVRSTDWAAAQALVPTMTSNTTPSGECFGSSYDSSDTYYKAFDGNDASGSRWIASTARGTACYIGYHFTTATECVKAKFIQDTAITSTTAIIQGSNDRETWIDLCDSTSYTASENTIQFTKNIREYTDYRLYISTQSGSPSKGGQIVTLQFYSASITDNSDAMTIVGNSNYASDVLLGGGANSFVKYPYYESTRTENGVTFTVNSNKTVTVNGTATGGFANFTFCVGALTDYITKAGVYSVDLGSTNLDAYYTGFLGIMRNEEWTDTNKWFGDDPKYTFEITEDMLSDPTCKILYQVRVLEGKTVNNDVVNPSPDTTWCEAICNSDYFESVLNVKVPTMTSNTTPSGVAYASAVRGSGFEAYLAFDNNDSTQWQAFQVSPPQYIYYKFATSQRVALMTMLTANARIYTFKIQSSNDGNTWIDRTDSINLTTTSKSTHKYLLVYNDGEYEYYRVYFSSFKDTNNVQLADIFTLQFYGREDV